MTIFTTLSCLAVLFAIVSINKAIIFYKNKKEIAESDYLLEQDQLRTRMVNKIINSPDLIFIARKYRKLIRTGNKFSHYSLKIQSKQIQNDLNKDITISAWVNYTSSIYKLSIDSENAYIYLTSKESKTLQSIINSAIMKMDEKSEQERLDRNLQESIQNTKKLEVIYQAI
jgi:dsRNA-specific ribonuclease